MKYLLSLIVAATLSLSTQVQAADTPNSLSAGFGPERSATAGTYSYKGNLVYSRDMGAGFSLGLTSESYQIQGGKGHNDVRTSAEAQASYQTMILGPASLRLGVGIGERMQRPTNFGYYALYASGNIELTDQFTWNTVAYRYRNSFDSVHNFGSHQLGTGLTWSINDTNLISAKVYRTYDSGWHSQSNGGALAYTVRF